MHNLDDYYLFTDQSCEYLALRAYANMSADGDRLWGIQYSHHE